MHTYHIVAGFEEDVLYVHDFDNHDKCIALAVYNKRENSWRVVFRGGAYGKQVIKDAIVEFDRNSLSERLNSSYKSNGYIGF